MLAKALAKESGAAFINITAASMQSKWWGTLGYPLAAPGLTRFNANCMLQPQAGALARQAEAPS
jgi:hypothetical protein